jgi:tetratricopeptide (TPR) repeat protein
MEATVRIRFSQCVILCLVTASVLFAQNTYDSVIENAHTLIEQNQLNEAAKEAVRAIAMDGTRWEAYALAGVAYVNQNSCQTAVPYFQAALSRAPEDKKTAIQHSIQACGGTETAQQTPKTDQAPKANACPAPCLVIRDPAEYLAYSKVVAPAPPAAKAASIEQFMSTYPNSVVRTSLLEQLMVTYQQAGDTTKTMDAAGRLLAVDPGNLRALAISVYLEKSQASTKTNPADAQPILDRAAAWAQTGLNSTKPAVMSDTDYQKLRIATVPIFYSAIARDDENKKDFSGAIAAFTSELKSYSDLTQTQSGPGLNDTYLLGQAYSQQTPPDFRNAAWFFIRATQFAPPQAKAQIEAAAKYFYNKFHGSMEGYPQAVALAQVNLFPPPDYNPTPAPPPLSPAELSAQTVASTPNLNGLSLADKEYILFNGRPEDAQKVWDTMKGARVQVPGTVISATADSVQVAVIAGNKQIQKADFTINMKAPLNAVPANGADVMFDATFYSYTASPPMLLLADGQPSSPKR